MEKALTCKRWQAYTVDNGAYARSYLCYKSTNGNEFPHGGFESNGDFSPVPLGVPLAHPVGRHVHPLDQDGSITVLVSTSR